MPLSDGHKAAILEAEYNRQIAILWAEYRTRLAQIGYHRRAKSLDVIRRRRWTRAQKAILLAEYERRADIIWVYYEHQKMLLRDEQTQSNQEE